MFGVPRLRGADANRLKAELRTCPHEATTKRGPPGASEAFNPLPLSFILNE